MRNVLALSLLLAVATCGVATAQTEYSLWDFKARGSVAIGGNYEIYTALGDQEAPPYEKEWTLGGYGAYNLVPKLSLVGQVAYGFDNNLWRSNLGLDYPFYDGEVDLSVRLSYEWVSSDGPTPDPSKEFTAGLMGAYPINGWLFAVASASAGLDTHLARYSIGLRVPVIK